MKLYSRAVSPFAARVRVSIRAKILPVEIIESPDVISAAYGLLNPLRQVPVLQLEDGRLIAESGVIVEYLEEQYSQTPLMPVAPLERARVRLVARVAELYLFPAVVAVLMGAAKSEGSFALVRQRLHELTAFLDDKDSSWHAIGEQLTIADAALAPFLLYVDMLGKRFNRALLTQYPRIARFWEGAQTDPGISPVLSEMGQAMRRPGAVSPTSTSL